MCSSDLRYDRPGPRYTGYPMPPAWSDDFPESEVLAALDRANARKDEAFSLYLHIPFCHRRCFYCDFPVVPLGDRASGAAGDPGSRSIATKYSHCVIATPSTP